MPETDELVITVNGQQLSGWSEIRVTRAIERVPSDFDIACTEKFPGQAHDILLSPGDPCIVTIGGDLILTGYVDQYTNEFSADKHNIRIRGRSKCQDLVDCSAGIDASGNFFGIFAAPISAVQLATTLCAPFNITVSQTGYPGILIPYYAVTIGETVYQVIERISRYAGFLAYDDVNGNLVLASVGQSSMESGFQEGDNVQAASNMFSQNQRFSDYWAFQQSTEAMTDTAPNTNNDGHAKDEQILRFRPYAFISEQFYLGQNIAQTRAQWERNRRLGRSQPVKIVCDTWRDSAGTLWQPNAYANVNLPTLKLNNQNWIISEVSYLRNLGEGTTADVTLMPAVAFAIQPEELGVIPQDTIVPGAAGGDSTSPNSVAGPVPPPPAKPAPVVTGLPGKVQFTNF